ARSKESSTRHAHWYSGVARHLYGSVYPHGPRDDRPDKLQEPERTAPGVLRHRRGGSGAQVADVLHQHRRHPRPRVGRARDAHGTAADLLLDEPRWIAARDLR